MTEPHKNICVVAAVNVEHVLYLAISFLNVFSCVWQLANTGVQLTTLSMINFILKKANKNVEYLLDNSEWHSSDVYTPDMMEDLVQQYRETLSKASAGICCPSTHKFSLYYEFPQLKSTLFVLGIRFCPIWQASLQSGSPWARRKRWRVKEKQPKMKGMLNRQILKMKPLVTKLIVHILILLFVILLFVVITPVKQRRWPININWLLYFWWAVAETAEVILLKALILQVICLYQKVVPHLVSQCKFDFSKLLKGNIFFNY